MGLTILQLGEGTTQMVGMGSRGAHHSEGENNQYRMSGRQSNGRPPVRFATGTEYAAPAKRELMPTAAIRS